MARRDSVNLFDLTISENEEGIHEASNMLKNVDYTVAATKSHSTTKYAPAPWNEYFDEQKQVAIPGTNDLFNVYLAGREGPVVFCLHGGGYCGLSFAVAAKGMKAEVRVAAMDMRGHGLTVTEDEADLSLERLGQDVLLVMHQLYGADPQAIVLVGHSMGGAVAVWTAASLAVPNLQALVVVDVVEGTAMASLSHMQSILAARPQHFASLDKAVEWSVRGSGSLRNLESAKVSVPATLRLDEASGRYVWRTNLEDSSVHWKKWYEGLSNTFLQSPVPKLLLLAGTDRLDRPLTIAHMQGKFQMLVIRHSGHAIQEDEPEEFSSAVLSLVHRNRIGSRGAMVPGLLRHRIH